MKNKNTIIIFNKDKGELKFVFGNNNIVIDKFIKGVEVYTDEQIYIRTINKEDGIDLLKILFNHII